MLPDDIDGREMRSGMIDARPPSFLAPESGVTGSRLVLGRSSDAPMDVTGRSRRDLAKDLVYPARGFAICVRSRGRGKAALY